MKVEFKKLGINGEGIGFIKHKPVFCDGVLPEETAEVEIIEEKPKYAMARLKRLITKSPDRIESPRTSTWLSSLYFGLPKTITSQTRYS